MKWLVRVAAGGAIGAILVAVFVRHDYVPRFGGLIVLILIGVGLYEGVDMGGDDDDDDDGGLVRPA